MTVVALLSLGIDWAPLAINPKVAGRREARGDFHPVRVIAVNLVTGARGGEAKANLSG